MSLHNPILPLRAMNIQKVLPAVYDDSLSYYELLAKIQEKCNELIDSNNAQNVAIAAINQIVVDFTNGGYLDSFDEFAQEWIEDNLTEYVEEIIRNTATRTILKQMYDNFIQLPFYPDSQYGRDGQILSTNGVDRVKWIDQLSLDDVGEEFVPFPESPQSKFGSNGQVLSGDGFGHTQWIDPVTVTSDMAAPIINAWLTAHPEYVTTIEDGAVSTPKLADGAVTRAKTSGVVEPLINDYFEVSANLNNQSIDTELMLYPGVTYTVDVIQYNGTGGNVAFYAVGDAPHALRVYGIGSYTMTPGLKAYLRLNTTAEHRITARVYAKKRNDAEILYLTDNGGITDLPELSSYPIRTNLVSESVPFTEHKTITINADSFCTVENYKDYFTDSGVTSTSDVLRIRNNDGTLVYNNLHHTGYLSSAGRAFTSFGKNGVFLRYVTYSQLEARRDEFLDDEYFVALCEYPTNFATFKWHVDDVVLEWLKPRDKSVYTVGGNDADFGTFTEMLVELDGDTTEKTVYVNGGVYDIYEEMGGAEYIATITNPQGMNWRDVCHVLSPNTNLVGVGDVILKWEPPASVIGSNDMAILFSPLNISGSCRIENITCTCSNGRYAIHDETSALEQFNNITHEFVNVKAINKGGTYGAARQAYGAGHGKTCKYIYKDCYFQGPWQNVFLMHDAPDNGEFEGSTMNFDGCVIRSTYEGELNKHAVTLRSQDTVGRIDKVHFNSCHIDNEIRFDGLRENCLQAYEVTMVGCNPVRFDWTSYIPTHVEPEVYNTIGESNE